MQVKHWLGDSISQLESVEIKSARLDCLIILEKVLNKDRSSILANDELELSSEQLKILGDFIQRRTKRVPLAYIIKTREFYGLNLYVDDAVLIPRPETETIVELAISIAPQNGHVLELGTGSGAISLALANNRHDLDILATDISQEALKIAKLNANNLHLHPKFITSDLFENVTGTFDMILANLPYVPINARRQQEIKHEPDIALYAGEDGLDYYRIFFDQVAAYLSSDGCAIVEFSPTQFTQVCEIATQFDVSPVSEYVYLCKKVLS